MHIYVFANIHLFNTTILWLESKHWSCISPISCPVLRLCYLWGICTCQKMWERTEERCFCQESNSGMTTAFQHWATTSGQKPISICPIYYEFGGITSYRPFCYMNPFSNGNTSEAILRLAPLHIVPSFVQSLEFMWNNNTVIKYAYPLFAYPDYCCIPQIFVMSTFLRLGVARFSGPDRCWSCKHAVVCSVLTGVVGVVMWVTTQKR